MDPGSADWKVIGLRGQQLWAARDAQQVVRLWRPEREGVQEGTYIRVYLDAAHEPKGWYDPASGQAVNQCHFELSMEPKPAPLACRGACGIVWEAPCAAGVLEHGETCLECDGGLSAVTA